MHFYIEGNHIYSNIYTINSLGMTSATFEPRDARPRGVINYTNSVISY